MDQTNSSSATSTEAKQNKPLLSENTKSMLTTMAGVLLFAAIIVSIIAALMYFVMWIGSLFFTDGDASFDNLHVRAKPSHY